MQTASIEQHQDIYTVSRLNNEVRFLLEDAYPFIWVEGEISNFSAPNSGHWYFCLKDAAAQVNCAMFRSSQRKVLFSPKDGTHVLVKGRVSLYENTGRFQLIIEDMEERGEGKLRRAFEVLKKKLEAAGLFDATHKKSLPLFPQRVGVITSATGAAIRDILTVLKRRYACASIVIYHTLVQGETAAASIVNAIHTATRRNECDVLILARGGGSLEDLWPFNEEIVAHAIYQCPLPIISGVGHEVDFTIADFVADKRAPTPSAAAEIVTPDGTELLQRLIRFQQQVKRSLNTKLSNVKQQLAWMQKHLSQQHPKRRLTEKMQRLDFCELTFVQLLTKQLNNLQRQLKTLDFRLHKKSPLQQIQIYLNQIFLCNQQLSNLMLTNLANNNTRLTNAAAKLDALSPLATLKRGFAIASKENQILTDATQVKKGDKIHLQLMKGSVDCIVDNVEKDS